MPSYETLDAIADAYIPSLAIISLILITAKLFTKQWKAAGIEITAFIVVALIAYGFMFLDRAMKIWPAFGLDYSTHTATALGLVMLLSFSMRKSAPFWISTLIAYILLMLYQRYHTVADIVTTAILVGIPFGLILSFIFRPQRSDSFRAQAKTDE